MRSNPVFLPNIFFIDEKELISPQGPEPEWSFVPGKVRHLNDDNFLEVLNSQKSVLVMFYSPSMYNFIMLNI